ncbi:MAG TPA: sigma factor-like helix-turn-helix DNA-binding protein [Spirillospora sp.]|nr:sigma factor-like helix-turn-helix DNA-binding protein [Spirillospora sp.]
MGWPLIAAPSGTEPSHRKVGHNVGRFHGTGRGSGCTARRAARPDQVLVERGDAAPPDRAPAPGTAGRAHRRDRPRLHGRVGRRPDVPAPVELLRLAAWEGLDQVAIATVLGCSKKAVRVRLYRARARLSRVLHATGFDATPVPVKGDR